MSTVVRQTLYSYATHVSLDSLSLLGSLLLDLLLRAGPWHEDAEGGVPPAVGGPVGDILLECRAGRLDIRVEGGELDSEGNSLVEMKERKIS